MNQKIGTPFKFLNFMPRPYSRDGLKMHEPKTKPNYITKYIYFHVGVLNFPIQGYFVT